MTMILEQLKEHRMQYYRHPISNVVSNNRVGIYHLWQYITNPTLFKNATDTLRGIPEEEEKRCKTYKDKEFDYVLASGIFNARNDQGITFETEADSLANTLKSDYGNFSDGLRKGFHHEDITYRRRKENEHVEIHNPKWTVYLTGTPGQVTNLIPSAENGLFSRFLFMKVDIPAKWHNVFSKSTRTIDEEMEAIGKRVYGIHLLLKNKQGGIEFQMTEEQQAKFNDFFNKLVEEYKDMLGRDFVANIYRMGLSAYRIAMILSITRLEGATTLPERIICKDEDLECALIIADTLMLHAARIFSTLLPNKEGGDVMGIKLSPKSEKLFAALPASFNRQMVLAAAQKLGIAKRTAEKYVGEYVSRYNLCKRVDNGKYEKVNLTENQQDSASH